MKKKVVITLEYEISENGLADRTKVEVNGDAIPIYSIIGLIDIWKAGLIRKSVERGEELKNQNQ